MTETTMDENQAAVAGASEENAPPAEPEKVKASFKEQIPYQAILLGGFALAASTFLSLGNDLTYEEIKLRKQEDLLASLSQVIPPATHDNDLLADVITLPRADGTQATIYRGLKEGSVSSMAFEMASPAYAGPIDVIIGVDNNGEVLGVRVLAHAETPGLGDKIEIAKDDWITSFNGLSFDKLVPEKWKVKKDGGVFDQFSGATITPRSVVTSVKKGLDFFHANKAELLKVSKEEKINE